MCRGRSHQVQGLETAQVQGSEIDVQGVIDLPGELARLVASLGQRESHPEMRYVIERLCAWRALSPEELERILGRGRAYLVRKFLSPMTRDGILERTIPETPAHPAQRYRAAGKDDA
jgi:hypothetical protein